MQRPARTFALPVPLSRMVAPYATIFGTAAGCWHRESYTTTNSIESLRREQAAHRGRRHLSQRRCHRPPVGTLLLEQKDEWAVKRARYMTLKPSVCLRRKFFICPQQKRDQPSRPRCFWLLGTCATSTRMALILLKYLVILNMSESGLWPKYGIRNGALSWRWLIFCCPRRAIFRV